MEIKNSNATELGKLMLFSLRGRCGRPNATTISDYVCPKVALDLISSRSQDNFIDL